MLSQLQKEEMTKFFQNFLEEEDVTVAKISEEAWCLPHFLGHGVYNTAFSFPEYPDYVFKVNIGENYSELSDDAQSLAEIYKDAADEDLSQYFLQSEILGYFSIEMGAFDSEYNEETDDYDDYDDDDSCETVTVSVQLAANDTFLEHFAQKDHIDWNYYVKPSSYSKEKHTLEVLEQKNDLKLWVGNDRKIDYAFLRRYGAKEFLRLAYFVQKEGLIDLHDENWGIKGNELVLIDYAM